MKDINKIGKRVIEITTQVGEFILEQRKHFSMDDAETKGYHDFVSYVDKEAELMLVNDLKLLLPESGFIAEEQTAGKSSEELIWIIDPLDGTTNFMHGVAPFAISIALQKNDETILGVIYELGHKEMFYSWEGTDAYCNNKKIQVSTAQSINKALISTGFPVNDFSRLSNHLNMVEQVVKSSHGLRRHGSAATDLAFVASGRIDGFFEYGLSVWDLAAGVYLVKKSGGNVSDYSGANNYHFGRELCAGNPMVQQELVLLLKDIMFKA